MSESARIRVNLVSGEVEVAGTEAFVASELAKMPSLLKDLRAVRTGKDTVVVESGNSEEPQDVQHGHGVLQLPETLGEWLHIFPDSLTQADQVLVAGYFAQSKSKENLFKTIEANRLLTEQGVKVANAAANLKELAQKKMVFVVKKSGAISLYRVSKTGEQHIVASATNYGVHR